MPTIHIASVTAFLSFSVSAACLLAAGVPHWIFIEASGTKYAPSTVCTGNASSCVANPYFVTKVNGDCVLHGTEWKERDIATTAALWIGVTIAGLAMADAWMIWLRVYSVTGSARFNWLSGMSAVASAFLMASLAVFGSTITYWQN